MDSTFIILFSIASLVAIVARSARIPYTIALVVVGLGVGSIGILHAPHLTKELLFEVFLPGLIFEAAYNLNAHELRANWRTVASLAVPGVVAAIALTALLAVGAFHLLGMEGALSWRDLLVFAALVAATDPIAVVSMFRQVGVSPRLTTLVEAESLFNDGTSIVVLSLVLAYVTGTAGGATFFVLKFAGVVGGGVLVGSTIAFLLAHVSKQLDDPMVEITLTVIAAYGSFIAAERLNLSGVIATVCAGLVLGTYGRAVAMAEQTRISVDAFWEYVAFAMNSIVFLLIGLEVRGSGLLHSAVPILVAFCAVVFARFGVVVAVTLLMQRTSERIPFAWAGLITWGGLRGALSMVLALALPADFPNRETLVNMTFGVVLLSLLLQGLTMPRVAARLSVASVS